jgi:cytoskeleton protein RodZ
MTNHRSDPTNDLLAGCGERLKQAREAAGLSVDDVAAKLHMPSRIVRSLEAEDWSRLGAPVFVRGQVRSYSRLMGLMTAPMMDALVDVGPVEPSRLVSRTHTPHAQWWAEQVGRRLVYIVLTLFLVVPAWVATRQHLSNTAPGTAPLDLPVDATGSTTPAQPKAAAPRTVVASMAPVQDVRPPGSDIVIRTRGESWITVTAPDGSSVEEGLVPANAERRYSAAQVGRLTIGNASLVDVQSQGRDVDMAAFARANVARFTVSSDGSLVASD